MPEFILNVPATATERTWARDIRKPIAAHPFYSLDWLARGYVEAMFFTNGDTGDSREFLLNEWGVECLTKEACESIARDCAAFESTVASDGRTVRQILDSVDDYDDEMAGRDFWFTRQGHGVGFTDRRELESDDSEYERLTGLMVEANARGDSAAWDAALADRKKLISTGDLLQACARRFREANIEAYRKRIEHR